MCFWHSPKGCFRVGWFEGRASPNETARHLTARGAFLYREFPLFSGGSFTLLANALRRWLSRFGNRSSSSMVNLSDWRNWPLISAQRTRVFTSRMWFAFLSVRSRLNWKQRQKQERLDTSRCSLLSRQSLRSQPSPTFPLIWRLHLLIGLFPASSQRSVRVARHSLEPTQ